MIGVWGQVASSSLLHISQQSWPLMVSLLLEIWKGPVSWLLPWKAFSHNLPGFTMAFGSLKMVAPGTGKSLSGFGRGLRPRVRSGRRKPGPLGCPVPGKRQMLPDL